MSFHTEQMADGPLALIRAADGVDASGNGLDLTPFGGPTGGASLDASDSGGASVLLADGNNLWNPEHYADFDLTTGASLSFLMNAATIGADKDLVRKNWLYGTYLDAAGKVHAVIEASGIGIEDLAGATTLVAGTTYHIGFSYDGTTIKLYVNGVLDGSRVRAGTLQVINLQSFTIGTSGIAEFDGFDGRIDEVALYDHALTAERFAAHAAANTAGGPVLWVDADNGASSDAGDRAAALDPATPLKTITRAAALAVDGDTIKFKPAAAANPGDTSDPSVYAPIYSGVYGIELMALADNVTVEGVSVGGVRPKWRGIHATDLVDWTVRHYQHGYDLDSGFEYGTNATLLGGSGFRCEDVIFTGGAYQTLGHKGFYFEDCTITARYNDGGTGFLEGNGFRVGVYTDYTIDNGDVFEWHRCVFNELQGEDAIQIFVGGDDGGGQIIIEDCTFDAIVQDGEFHTDGIQSLGCSLLRVARCTFGYTALVSSMIISSDGFIGRLELENNLFVGRPGSGFLTQFAGVSDWLIRHNTWLGSGFAGLRLYSNGNLPADGYTGLIHSNIIDNFQVNIATSGAGITWEQHDNVIGLGNITVDDIEGFPEFGTSADTSYELANSGGILSPGIDQGWDADPDALLLDRLGRGREGAAPDCGCHESSLSALVTAEPRAPIVIAFTPASGSTGVSPTTNVTAKLFPKPGQTIDPATVTSSSFLVRDSDGYQLPIAGITVGSPDGAGHQLLTLDIDGSLYPRVQYNVLITTAIEDTEDSALASNAGVSWRSAGPTGPAVYAAGEEPGSGGGGWVLGAVS